MKERHIIIILVLVLVVLGANIIQKKYIDPKTTSFLNGQIEDSFISYIIYKNHHRGFSLFMTDDSTRIAHSKLPELYEGTAFNKPELGEEVQHIIGIADIKLYENSHIGDKIEKLPNSNKCYLYKKDSIFKYNCYAFSDKDRQEIGKIDVWNSNETGFWKLVK